MGGAWGMRTALIVGCSLKSLDDLPPPLPLQRAGGHTDRQTL